MHQIFVNLLTNAAKFTPAGGHISVEFERTGDAVLIHVRDSGVGIAEENLSQIFEPFFQEADGQTDIAAGDGIGLGLALAKQLVHLHGGAICVQSSANGSVFTVRLQASEESPLVQPAGRKPTCRHELDIVIVEDNDDAREMLELLLTSHGCRVRSADCGASGVALVAEAKPEVVILDIGLPDMNGYEVAAKVRANATHAMHLIALTGYGQPDDVRRSQEAGFDEHMVKPVKMDQLLERLGVAAAQLGRQT